MAEMKPQTTPDDRALVAALAEIERLKAALEQIAAVNPCEDMPFASSLIKIARAALAAAAPDIFPRLPLSSADSCNAAINGGAGRPTRSRAAWEGANDIADWVEATPGCRATFEPCEVTSRLLF